MVVPIYRGSLIESNDAAPVALFAGDLEQWGLVHRTRNTDPSSVHRTCSDIAIGPLP
jgi:hypothetical protein